MDHIDPGLFDLPVSEQQRPRWPRRARNREKWRRTVVAEFAIVDTEAFDFAIARARANMTVIDSHSGTHIENPSLEQMGAGPGLSPLDTLAWIIWPTDGMDAAIENGAVRVVDVECAVNGEHSDRGTATWSVTATLTHVDRLRQLATQACSEDANLIADDLELAWRYAADPYAPLRDIVGIEWKPVSVHVEHVPARSARMVR